MQKLLLTFLLSFTLLTASAQDNPRISHMDFTAPELAHYMAPGWNLGNTLEAGNNADVYTDNAGTATETSWQGTKTSQKLISFLKAKGFNSVRLPVSWVMGHLTDKENMTLDGKWVARIREIVDYCMTANMYVVLNDHWDGGWLEYDGFTDSVNVAAKKEQLRKLWTNIANAFKDYDERLIFAGLNEPGVGSKSPYAEGTKIDEKKEPERFNARLLEYEQVFIDAVRATGGNNARRVLVVQGPKTDMTLTLAPSYDVSSLKDPADNRLMVEVHHYDPYQFTMMPKDEDWGKVYYYWNGHGPSDDSTHTTPVKLENEIIANMNNMKAKFVDNGVPVIIGEYGSNIRSMTSGSQDKHDESLQYWYNFNTAGAYKAGLIPFAWDTNVTNHRPCMTIVDRSTVSIFGTSAYEGIMQGDKAGRRAFNAIYPEPSHSQQ